ncbi:MAG TPA: marine proteobacterial sortase target protein, partial [Alphaproteobacteria bacterium]
DADGGTEMAPALARALTGAPPQGKLRQVVFLTDGAVGNETELFAIIDDDLGASRLFTVGIGSAPNSYFMAKAAEIGRGTFTHIGETSQVAERMEALFAKLEHPVMTDIDTAWPAGLVPHMSRATLPDLYAGEPVVFTARLDALEGAVTVSGVRDGEPWAARLDLAQAAPAHGIAALWARDRIDAMLHESGVLMDPAEVQGEVVALALAHHLVTKFTSLVAVDVTPTRPEGAAMASRKLPHNLPYGWDYEKLFGAQPQPAAPLQRDAAAQASGATLASADAAVVVGTGFGLSLPQGATPAQLHWLIGLALLVIGLAALGRLCPA